MNDKLNDVIKENEVLKLAKLKRLIFLTDDVVSNVTMNEVTRTQILEFWRTFPDENPNENPID